MSPTRNARAAPRYDIDRKVLVFCDGADPRQAVSLNVSKLGVALRVEGATPAPATGADFEAGDQVIVQNLVDLPVECWVVAFSDDILRLRFVASPAANMQIRKLVDGIAASVETENVASVQPRRWRRWWYVAAAAAVATVVVVGAFSGWFRDTSDVRKQLADVAADPSASARRLGPNAQPRPQVEPLGVVVNTEVSAELPPGSPPPRQLFRIPAGSTMAVKVTALDKSHSDGRVEAILDQDFYDFGDRSHVLLPQGSRFIGRLARDRGKMTQTVSWTSVELPGNKRIRFVLVSGDKAADVTEDAVAPLVTPDIDKARDGHAVILLRKDIALSSYSDKPAPPR